MRLPFLLAIAMIATGCSCAPAAASTSTDSTTTTSSTTSSSATSSSATSSVTTSSATSSSSSAACTGNTNSTRSEWCDYDISTDYYSTVPDTGVTREYWFNLEQVTIAPDGYSRTALTVNGTIPGPTIIADWGDTVVVHVTNSLTESHNGTSIHFHGVRQNYTNQMDGVSSITQCPTAPGDSYTYTWRATQYGSSWYHSHWALQAWEGVFGGILINGPATADYDEDLGVLFLNDWSHQTVDEQWYRDETSGPVTQDTGLINGTNVYSDDDSSDETGYRFNVTFEAGTSYRLRLVNAAVDTLFKFSIDNHTLQVIASDFVPIEPYNTTVLNINMGQRYDVIVLADQEDVATAFWMRAIPQIACSNNDNTDNIKGIVYYGTSTDTPDTTAYSYTDACVDEDSSDLVPYLALDASDSSWSADEVVTVGKNSDNFFRWYLNDSSMALNWQDPTLLQVYNNVTTFNTSSNLLSLSTANEWAYIIIETSAAVAHPIHLHGHDFYLLASGTGTYSSSDLNLTNPPRRDVATLQASGYLVLAFQADNPGAWLLHCHIGFHTSEGFALQILERQSEISDLIDYDTLHSNCENWTTYQTDEDITDDDSGI